MTSKTIAEQLGKNGLCVCPEFLSARALRDTAIDFEEIRASGQFHHAGIGHGQSHGVVRSVRNDDTYWLDRKSNNRVQNLLWRKLDLLKHAFNRKLFLGLTNFEGHYASYPEGGSYERHKDCYSGDSARVVSFVLYLNRAWKFDDGGHLRLYFAGANNDERHLDVDPLGGTMVCFLSGETEHEVLLTNRQRFSLTGWFRRDGLVRDRRSFLGPQQPSNKALDPGASGPPPSLRPKTESSH